MLNLAKKLTPKKDSKYYIKTLMTNRTAVKNIRLKISAYPEEKNELYEAGIKGVP